MTDERDASEEPVGGLGRELTLARQRGLDDLDLEDPSHTKRVGIPTLEQLARRYAGDDRSARVPLIKEMLTAALIDWEQEGHAADAAFVRSLLFGSEEQKPADRRPGALLDKARIASGLNEDQFDKRRRSIFRQFAQHLTGFVAARPASPISPESSTQVGSPTVASEPHRPWLRQRLIFSAIGIVVLLTVVFTIVIVNADTSSSQASRDEPSSSSTPTLATGVATPTTTAPTTTTSAATGVPAGKATITVVYDVPGGCSTKYTIAGDLQGDPNAVGKTLWIAAVLSAPPNVLYYPKVRVTPEDGRFTVTLDANTLPGVRNGRFGLIVTPSDPADADLQLSKEADETRNDSLYPDPRRVQLQLGNKEIATTPFVDQRC